jgi:hypothetical protein
LNEIDRAVALVKAAGDRMDGGKEERAEQLESLLGKARGLGDIALAEYPPIDWTITNLLPTGFAIFSGGSKLGKTWICLQLASAVSLGLDFLGNSDYRCKKGGVLLLALQISDRMLHNRMEVAGIMGDDRVSVLHAFPCGEEALDAVRRWKELHPDTRLVIIDMLEQVRDRDPEHENTYSVNVKEISRWATLADELKIAILGTTHDRKAVSGDFVSDIVGSVGAVGSAAVLWSLKRSRGKADATLFASGWEIMDHELPLQFDQSTGWQLLPGTVAAVTLTRERQEILDFLLMQKEPISPSTVAIALEKKPGTVRKLLMELKNDHFVECPRYGLYIYSNTGNSSNSNGSNSREKGVTSVTVTYRLEELLKKPSAPLPAVPALPKNPAPGLTKVDPPPPVDDFPDSFEDDPLPASLGERA